MNSRIYEGRDKKETIAKEVKKNQGVAVGEVPRKRPTIEKEQLFFFLPLDSFG